MGELYARQPGAKLKISAWRRGPLGERWRWSGCRVAGSSGRLERDVLQDPRVHGHGRGG